MEQIFGVTFDGHSKVEIADYNDVTYYDFAVVARILSDRNGNGFRELQFNENGNKSPKQISLNNWKIDATISVPYSWSGSKVHPKIIDPTGSIRQIYADSYSKTIYKGISPKADIEAVFDTLVKYSKYQSWSEYDVECAVIEKDVIIKELTNKVIGLEDKLKKIKSICANEITDDYDGN